MDARGPFDGAKLPPLRQNEFGATLGGPIKKNRAFLFGNYTGFRQRAGQTIVSSVPTANERNDIFLASEGVGTLYDPLTHAPFSGNAIPASRVNPVGQKLLNLYPSPNLPGRIAAGAGVASNYSGVVVQQQNATRLDTRFDYTVNSKNTLFVRY